MSAMIADRGTSKRPRNVSSVVIRPPFWRSWPPSGIRPVAALRSWASDPAEIGTDHEAADVGAKNAWLVLQARRMDLAEAMIGVTAIIASLRGASTIDAICALVEEHVGYGFFAIIRMIDDGSLRCVTPGLFTGATLVEPVARC